jgi:hypothetical protein
MKTKLIKERGSRNLGLKNVLVRAPRRSPDSDGKAGPRLAVGRGGSPACGAATEGGAPAAATNRFGEYCFLLRDGLRR